MGIRPILQPIRFGQQAGILSRFCLGFVIRKPGGIFIACLKPVTATTELTAGTPNGRESATLDLPKNLNT